MVSWWRRAGKRVGDILRGGYTKPSTEYQVSETERLAKTIPTSPQAPAGYEYAGTTGGGIIITKTPSATGGAGTAAPAPQAAEMVTELTTEQPPKPTTIEDVSKQPTLFQEKAKSIYGIAYTGLTGLTQEQRQQQFQEEQRKIQFGEREKKFVPSGRGTVIREQRPYTKEEVEKIARESPYEIGRQRGALLELQRREEVKYGRAYTSSVNSFAENLMDQSRQEIQESKQRETITMENIYSDLQTKVNRGEITVEKANDLLKDETDNANSRLENNVDRLNKQNEEKIKKHGKEWVESSGKELEKGSEKYLNKIAGQAALSRTIARIPITVAIGAGLGAAGAASATAAAGLKVAAGAGIVYSGYSVIKNPKALTKENIASFGINVAALAVGAKIGAGVVTSVKTTQVNAAINRADVVSKSPKILTKEAQIAKVQIPEQNKAIIKQYIKRGLTVRETRSDIVPKTAKDAKIINKALPKRSIRFIEVIDQQGNVIDRVAIGKITITKGQTQFTQDVISKSVGAVKETGEFETETLTLIGKAGKPIKKVIATKERGKAEIIKIKDITATRGKVEILERGRLEATKGKPITKVQIKELLLKEPKLKAKGEFLQIGKKVISIKEIEQIGKDIFLKKGEIITGKGVSKVSQIIKEPKKPITFKSYKDLPKQVQDKLKYKRPISYKNLKEAVTTSEKDYPSIVQVGGKAQSIYQLDTKSIFFKPLKKPIILETGFIGSEGIKAALSSAAKDLTIIKTPIVLPPVTIPKQELKTEFQFKDLEKLKLEVIQKPEKIQKTVTRIKQVTTPLTIQQLESAFGLKQPTIQLQKLEQQQAQQFKQLQKLEQYTPLKFITPSFMIPPPPTPYGRGLDGAETQRLLKSIFKQPKRRAGYAASLQAAAFQQRPTKVTEKQFKQLQKQIYSGFETRPVLQIVSEKKLKKQMKEQEKNLRRSLKQKTKGSSTKRVIF